MKVKKIVSAKAHGFAAEGGVRNALPAVIYYLRLALVKAQMILDYPAHYK
jgi:hypothetical protein